MGLGSKILGLGLTGAFAIPEYGKLSKAAKKGKLKEQIFGSVINVGKWSAIPALIALTNPVSGTAVVATGLAGLILPELIEDIDVTKKKKSQGISGLA